MSRVVGSRHLLSITACSVAGLLLLLLLFGHGTTAWALELILALVLITLSSAVLVSASTGERPEATSQPTDVERRFTARVSHELRTPLTIIKGENQVLLARERSVAEYEQQLRSNVEEVERMEKIIDDLILFSQYESGETEIPLGEVHLDEVVASAVKDLRPLAVSKHISLALNCEAAVIIGDQSSLERLVCKLVENAIQYTPEQGTVTVNTFREDSDAVLTVGDTGIGIPENELDLIFTRFYRCKNASAIRNVGSGLGLALVQTIATLHNATINVNGQVGEGTIFRVSMPLQR